MNKLRQLCPYIAPALALLLLLVLNLFFQDHWLDSDMAAEMIFSRLLAEQGHVFATPDWYYSTEFRILYTQLIMAPLFHVLSDWHVIRTVTNLVFYGLMLGSYFYFLKPLKVSRTLTLLSSCILLLPFSETMMTHVQIGNTYMSHIILVLWFFGMFLRLAAKERKGFRRAFLWVMYLCLGFICGVSGVRYLLALQCPLLLTALFFLMGGEGFQGFRAQLSREKWKILWDSREMAIFLCSLLGAAAGVVGYGVNVLLISKKYVFQTYGATNFIPIYQGELFDRIQNAIGSLLMLFGYIPEKSFLSLRGIVTIAAFLLLGLLFYAVIKSKKRENRTGFRLFVTLFLIVSFLLNMFVFIFTTSTMVPRYYLTIFIFALPVLCFYLEEEPLPLDRLLVALLFFGCILLGTAKTVFSFIGTDKNADRRQVAQFLSENGYDFGYASYNNGNIITELTGGQVEIANINNPEELLYFRWSSPMKYYDLSYHTGRVFLLLTAEEYAAYPDAEAVRLSEPVYEDGSYVVFSYDSANELMRHAQ